MMMTKQSTALTLLGSSLLLLLATNPAAEAFCPPSSSTQQRTKLFMSTTDATGSPTSSSTTTENDELAATVTKLKRVLAKEYTSFFNPMVDSWYAPDVTFTDPMTSLSGVDSYRKNVDMLAGRTLMGKVLFEGAGINLHSVTGGEIVNGRVDDIVTRWTLRLTAKVLPWSPEAVFSGVSVYKIALGGKEGLSIVGQTDYWDSINIQPDTPSTNVKQQYQTVPKNIAVSDFLAQLAPTGFLAPTAAPELPYLLLRRGDGYELRKYPGFVGVETPYMRRDYGFGSLGAFAKGMDPLAPSICKVYNDDNVDDGDGKEKMMMWPLKFAFPGEGTDAPPAPAAAIEKAGSGQWASINIMSQPERIVAIRAFEDAAMGPVVRNADRELRAMLKRDGLEVEDGTEQYVLFTQYDAVHSMGKRRSEVWIDLKDGGHPF
mmetsp:Transcript_28731/g.57863  ORF Transcript_28731/g.57863 Transcript_28731/m.57863 type:complete len:430 (+) Transcript_28731:99-1388(+)|eukprot:CAMPEP_0113389150 /NCGR_PEP_ID=MMETSP0013_2-20120614/9469_1 /TAXON_ID=2843 ORGANISM="Skeletonema costatum, Strain 1716" /NCGR_SAMPLE_ID=MMETSP0013_2 /ASSEMBLY_ACC=CAM_ASM_000158 /LENGTH=429 /DNA_ID=CAMNT_0000272199 /DNA_START=99 /DNA_END=1388 /DNA_ORIENTATION=- /assembly_acc=CAM_ASM_000158